MGIRVREKYILRKVRTVGGHAGGAKRYTKVPGAARGGIRMHGCKGAGGAPGCLRDGISICGSEGAVVSAHASRDLKPS